MIQNDKINDEPIPEEESIPHKESIPAEESIPFENDSFCKRNRFLQKVPKMAKESESRFFWNRNRHSTIGNPNLDSRRGTH